MAVSKLDEVVSLAKRRGFVFPAGEIYGGTRSAWDYGPLGVALKDNIKREWWRSMVVTRGDVRRAKLYYLRDRVGKAAKVKEKRD